MKPATTLKGLLKPPFECESLGAPDLIRINGLYRDKPILLSRVDKITTKLLQFVTQALNEKWERDFSEPLHWITCYMGDVEYLRCPECDWDDSQFDHETFFNYCPCCGQRLLPPEEVQEK